MLKSNRLKHRLDRLVGHLDNENPDLVLTVQYLRELDTVAHRMGLLPEGESYANNISWWPLISVLGTFSAGKSSFINTLLGIPLQKTGNQAVDDRFTVITYSRGQDVQTLPGQALDADPRFPFYRISEDLHDVIPGEGEKIDQYLQMKVVPSEMVRGRIIIDSPGFDADDQRRSVLEITDHIIGLSDLVLVFFDGRHPEAGAMRDTLEHLIPPANRTKDADKFLFILNQIDTSAREDNMEEIVAAWRGAMSQYGLNSGNFFVHYNDELAQPASDDRVWQRYRNKRDADYADILKRINDINVHRTYRIVGKIKPLADDIEHKAVPRLMAALDQWRSSVVMYDFLALSLIALLFGLFITTAWNYIDKYPIMFVLAFFVAMFALIYSHFSAKQSFSDKIALTLGEEPYGDLRAAFKKSTAGWRSVFWRFPSGWGLRSQSILERIREKTESLIVELNTKMANPSGRVGHRKNMQEPEVIQTVSRESSQRRILRESDTPRNETETMSLKQGTRAGSPVKNGPTGPIVNKHDFPKFQDDVQSGSGKTSHFESKKSRTTEQRLSDKNTQTRQRLQETGTVSHTGTHTTHRQTTKTRGAPGEKTEIPLTKPLATGKTETRTVRKEQTVTRKIAGIDQANRKKDN